MTTPASATPAPARPRAVRPSAVRPSAGRTRPSPAGIRRAVRGGALGNYVDQFDIMLPVAALTPAAEHVFGPGHLAGATGWVFAATLLGRPIGAAVFGPLADRVGRTATTRVALAGIAVTTALIAVVPGHTVLGAGTIALVVALRFLGGVFVGGEYTAAVPLAMEWSDPRRRGHLSGLVMSMSPWASTTIAALVLLLVSALPDGAYAAWGWRVPFVVGALMAAGLCLYYRTVVPDSDAWLGAPQRRHPLRDVLVGSHRRALAQVLVLMSGLWLLTQMAVPTMTAAVRDGGVLDPQALSFALMVATAASAIVMHACGAASTRTGRRRFFVAFAALAVVAAPATWWALAAAGGAGGVVALMVALQLVTVTAYGPVGAYLAERFPAGVRASGYGVGYSLSIVVPALYPVWLPALQGAVGADAAVMGVLALGAVLLGAGAWLGPETDRERPLP
ncbi:MFS transporter [Isoptericola hypogeus]|uniref:MFS transporter n=1 Tax=Isoptericola hypogeus TaxID=300179 RepID=A0ABN2J0K8_9MICO